MERLIPVEIFRKKNAFRGITFYPFLPKLPKFSVPFVCFTSALARSGFELRESEKFTGIL